MPSQMDGLKDSLCSSKFLEDKLWQFPRLSIHRAAKEVNLGKWHNKAVTAYGQARRSGMPKIITGPDKPQLAPEMVWSNPIGQFGICFNVPKERGGVDYAQAVR